MTEQHVLHQKINLPYRYTAGDTYTAFLNALASRRLVGSRCEACGSLAVPARPFCPVCSQPTQKVEDLEAEGRLESWTKVRNGGDRVVFGAIRVADSATVMLHRVEAGAVALEPNLEVIARWSQDPQPDITAIEAWVPAGG